MTDDAAPPSPPNRAPERQHPPRHFAEPGSRYALLVCVAAAVVALDQLTKTWAQHALRDRTIHLFWTLQLNLSFNSGVAFGLGGRASPFLVVVAVVVVVLLLAFSRSV